MKAIDLIRWALQTSEQGMLALVGDMRNAPLTPSTPGARGGDGNHPLWIMGHLAYVEGAMQRILVGRENPVEHWEKLFGTGSRPAADADAYPQFEEVVATFRRLRAQNLALLEEIGEEGLGRPPAWVPPGFEDAMRTAGHTLLLAALHQMVHYGQVADARRVAGLAPLM